MRPNRVELLSATENVATVLWECLSQSSTLENDHWRVYVSTVCSASFKHSWIYSKCVHLYSLCIASCCVHHPCRTPAVFQCVRTCYCQLSTPSLRVDHCTFLTSRVCAPVHPFCTPSYTLPCTVVATPACNNHSMQSSSFSALSTCYCRAPLSSPVCGSLKKRLDCVFTVHPQNVRFQNVRFQNVWFQNVQFLNLIYLLNKKYRNFQVWIPI